MNWTLKGLVRLIGILTLWLAGWGVVDIAVRSTSQNWPSHVPLWPWLEVVLIVCPVMTYFFAGPITAALYVCWIRGKAEREQENVTRQSIAEFRRHRIPQP